MHQLFRPFHLGNGLATGSQGATVAPHEVPAVRHKGEHGGGACVLVFGGATSLGAHWRDEVGVTAVTVQEEVQAVNLGPHCVG